MVAASTLEFVYAVNYATLSALGYSTLPLGARTKYPAINGWQRMCDDAPSEAEHKAWSRKRDAGIGMACGYRVGEYQVLAIDLDVDGDALEKLASALPSSNMEKIGRKGLTRFFLADPSVAKKAYNDPNGRRLADRLAHGRMVALPPTVHPNTGRPYVWTAGPVAADKLPILSLADIEMFEDALEALGWSPDEDTANAAATGIFEASEHRHDASHDFHRELNERALANLGEWIPTLGLCNLRLKRGGYSAVAHWRPSSSGRQIEKRARNLSIVPSGIVDFGDGDRGYSPLDLVITATERTLDEAVEYLSERTGLRAELDAFCQLDIVKELERTRAKRAAKEAQKATARGEQHATEALDGTLHDTSTREVIPPSPELPTPTNDNASSRALVISATPFILRDPRILPRRQWVLGKFCCRKEISTTIAPGGVGKTSLSHTEAVALASGKNLLGFDVPDLRKVWIWNGEEPLEEMERRIGAICLHHRVSADELGGRLFVDTADDLELVLCEEVRGSGAVVRVPVVDALVEELESREIDVMIVDPFISTHNCTENDNNSMQKAATAWKKVAQRANCAIHLVHHTRKSNGQTITSDSSRGGDALVSKSRAVRPLNPLSEKDAKRIGVSSAERRSLFWYDPAGSKVNMTAATGSREWYRLVSVPLWNQSSGVLDPGDEIGVVTRWEAPAAVANLNIETAALLAFKADLRDGFFLCSPQAHNNSSWVGHAIARHFDLDTSDARWKPKAKTIWRQLLDEDEVIEAFERDSAHQTRKVGRPAPDAESEEDYE